MGRTLLVVGARNLGGAICEHFAALGWNVAAISLTEHSAMVLSRRLPQALTIALDAADASQLETAVDRVVERFGSLDMMINAASPSGPSHEPFGGGRLTDTDPADFERYSTQVARQVFTFLQCAGRALSSKGGTVIQITGGSARRAMAGRGSWAAGAFATRALCQAGATELREEGVHVGLVIVDAVIGRSYDGEQDDDTKTTDREVAAAVDYLAAQPPHAWTHELQITPRGDRWVP
jgi:NAD(P)-dependent dehydrogenase (short-subunit alcohol dehydrogenase family)